MGMDKAIEKLNRAANTASFITGVPVERCKEIYEELKPVWELADRHMKELTDLLTTIKEQERFEAVFNYHYRTLKTHPEDMMLDIMIFILKGLEDQPKLRDTIKKFIK